jgi:hypothetical protein
MHAQFTYSTNYGGIAITGYSGGNNAVIPSTINGLPVAFIGSEAFYWITWLTSVTIPSSVTTIKNAAFYECTSLSEVYFQGNAPGLDGGNWFYGDNGATVYYLLGTTGWGTSFGGRPAVALPGLYNFMTNSGTITITGYTGSGGAVTIPSPINGLPVTSIGSNVFYNCTALTAVTIPNSVTNISNYAFCNCTALTTVTIPNNVSSIGTDAFSECSSLTSVTIGNGATSIGDYAFYKCTSLAGVYFQGNAPLSLGSDVFYGDNNTTVYYLPGTTGWNTPFGGRPAVLWVPYTFTTNNSTITITGYTGSIGAVTIPSTISGLPVTTIQSSAFRLIAGLTSVTIPNSVTSIGNDAFYLCSSLTSVTIGSGVTSIGAGAFSGCSSLASVAIPNSVTSIGNAAFYGCTSLTSATIGTGGTSINQYAFYGCTSLNSVTIGDGLTSIEQNAFCGCTSLNSVTIGNGITSIEDYAFNDCISLAGIYFRGNAPTSVGSEALYLDNNATVYYLSGTTGWGTSFCGRPTVALQGAPSIISQPQSQTVYQGLSATLTVAASGAQQLYYQWRFNGANIAGANTNNCTITNVQPTDAGSYSVVITNIAGAVTSNPALLTVASIGQSNQVLSLDGSSGYVSIPSSPDLQNPTDITVEAWVYPKPPHSNINGNYGWFVVKSDGQNATSARSYEINWGNTGNGEGIIASIFFSDGTWSQVWASLPETNWVHVACTFSSTSGVFRLFTNGVSANTASALAGKTLRQTTLALELGGETIIQGPLFATGYMDEVRIWNKARTQAEIAESRFCRLTGSESNLAGYWSFDTGTAADLTGHGHDGALQSGASFVPIPAQDVVHQGICGPPYFDPASLAYTPGAGFHQTVYGPSGLDLEVDASTNLLNWLPLFVLTNFSGRFEFVDPAALNFQQRFYRSVAQ